MTVVPEKRALISKMAGPSDPTRSWKFAGPYAFKANARSRPSSRVRKTVRYRLDRYSHYAGLDDRHLHRRRFKQHARDPFSLGGKDQHIHSGIERRRIPLFTDQMHARVLPQGGFDVLWDRILRLQWADGEKMQRREVGAQPSPRSCRLMDSNLNTCSGGNSQSPSPSKCREMPMNAASSTSSDRTRGDRYHPCSR